jgi:hypothetical protein
LDNLKAAGEGLVVEDIFRSLSAFAIRGLLSAVMGTEGDAYAVYRNLRRGIDRFAG